ncbi:GFA family protein [Minwuia thermotolerans]|uniref:Alanine acetyltransferase n=1 Tax=Minwuia thermotolerans TaxID=2056226 RepID=A0A2M9G6L6_9PROT|nr:GFA family protein [Minwuia thermotolerans]PJK31365.1 alanine acetyltransferase [Minwuia thermotolerans]
MLLEGSCHCKAVRFRVESRHPYPFNLCYCSICRKTSGGGGYAVNLGADNTTLEIEGGENLRVYRARMEDERTGEVTTSNAERSFCGECGTHLWLWDSRWPDLVHPLAGVVDTDLPVPPERTHLMMDFKPDWVLFRPGEHDQVHGHYPDESLEDWHKRLGLES